MTARIAAILPPAVSACTRTDPVPISALFPVEQAAVVRAVEARRAEFAGGRACGHCALGLLGIPKVPIRVGSHGEPRWPDGIVGSITHCEGFCAAVVAKRNEVQALGIDATPHSAVPSHLVDSIITQPEQQLIRAQAKQYPELHIDRIVFSAKEAAYKAWHGFGRTVLDFHDGWIELDLRSGSFQAYVRPAARCEGISVHRLRGRWMVHRELVITAVAMTWAELAEEQRGLEVVSPPRALINGPTDKAGVLR